MIELVLMIALLGLVVWVLVTYIPMPPPFKTIIIVVAALLVILYVMRALGIPDIPLRR